MRVIGGMRQELASADTVVAQTAGKQYGVVTSTQLLAAGLSPDGITRRVAAGRLHRVYRGVYAAGHTALSNEGRWFAAVAACGKDGLLSHRSAAELWRMLPVSAGAIHV